MVPTSSADILDQILGKQKEEETFDQPSTMFNICKVIFHTTQIVKIQYFYVPQIFSFGPRNPTERGNSKKYCLWPDVDLSVSRLKWIPVSILGWGKLTGIWHERRPNDYLFKDAIIREAVFVPGRAGVKGKFSTALERWWVLCWWSYSNSWHPITHRFIQSHHIANPFELVEKANNISQSYFESRVPWFGFILRNWCNLDGDRAVQPEGGGEGFRECGGAADVLHAAGTAGYSCRSHTCSVSIPILK